MRTTALALGTLMMAVPALVGAAKNPATSTSVTGDYVEARTAEVFLRERLLVGAALHFERTDGRDEHRGLGVQSTRAALDVEELLGAQIRAKARFGHHDVCQR